VKRQHGKQFLVSFELARISGQQSAHEDNGVLLQATLRGLSACVKNGRMAIVEPTVVTLW
jgi:hypothetical protein